MLSILENSHIFRETHGAAFYLAFNSEKVAGVQSALVDRSALELRSSNLGNASMTGNPRHLRIGVLSRRWLGSKISRLVITLLLPVGGGPSPRQ
jgi:hypothetical protein